jgi:hypothetical protein
MDAILDQRVTQRVTTPGQLYGIPFSHGPTMARLLLRCQQLMTIHVISTRPGPRRPLLKARGGLVHLGGAALDGGVADGGGDAFVDVGVEGVGDELGLVGEVCYGLGGGELHL